MIDKYKRNRDYELKMSKERKKKVEVQAGVETVNKSYN